jgi:hypothetical protein
MRSSKQRSRSKSNRPKSLGNVVNRVFDSSGPEGKVRGTPQQIIDKYLVLARDSQLSGDRVAHENFLQHAEHYTRMLSEAQREQAREQEARRDQQQQHNQNRRTDAHDGGERSGYGRDDADARGDQSGRDQSGRDQSGRDQSGRDGGDRRPNGRDDRGHDRPERRNEAPLPAADEGDSMLVETPESRARHAASTDEALPERAAESPASEAPAESAETTDAPVESAGEGKRPRQPRARTTPRRAPRKAKSDDSETDPKPGNGSAAAAE